MRKIYPEDIIDIQMAYKQGESQRSIARRYEVNVWTINFYTKSEEERRKIQEQKYRKKSDHCDCGVLYKKHERCSRCTKLLHGEKCNCHISPKVKEYDYPALYQFIIKIMLNELT